MWKGAPPRVCSPLGSKGPFRIAFNLITVLAAVGITFARVNPRQAREFARAIGVLAKTDRVDARVLTEMERRLPLEVTVPPDPA